MRLAVVMPSRGLIHSRTIAEVLAETRDRGAHLFFAHSRPIPECFNEPCTEALAWGADRVWIVEEDMSLPPGILDELWDALDAGHPIAAADYPVLPGIMSVRRDPEGRAMHTGTGCLLAEAPALAAAMPFDTGWQYVRHGTGPWARQKAPAHSPTAYGQHDVDFGMRLHAAGTPIHIVPTRCTQYVVAREAAHKRNTLGWHDIAAIPLTPSQEDTPA